MTTARPDLLALRGVSFRYPAARHPALAGIDLTVRSGDVVGIVGPNDAGKSTLCLVAAGLAPRLTGGQLTGVVARTSDAAGIVFADPAAQRTGVTATVFEEVAFGPVNLGRAVPDTIASVRAALRAVGMEDLAHRHPARLSGGQSQLLALACTLAMGPPLLVLDEPTAGLDDEATGLVVKALTSQASKGAALLIAEHRIEVLTALGARIVQLEQRS